MNKKKLIALLLAAVMLLTLAACSKTPVEETDPGTSAPVGEQSDDKVLVIGVDGTFGAKWNPFLAENYSDSQVVDQLFAAVCRINEDNEIEPYAGDITSKELDNGYVEYTITIQKDMHYTDGVEVTIDDYIYAIYVRSDPSYTGPENLLASNILGVEEYFYDNANYSADIAAIEAECEKYASDVITFEDFVIYAEETDMDGWWGMYDGLDSDAGGVSWRDYFIDYTNYGEELETIDENDADAVFALLCKAEYDAIGDYDVQGYYLEMMKTDYALGNLEGGANVTEISGVKKVDDYTCTVTMTVVDIYADRSLTVKNGTGYLIPRHYYGELTKGDVAGILANMEPMGSGPYMFQEFKNNIVTATANDDFFLGAPKTGMVRWKYVPTEDVLENLASGDIDIAEPSASLENFEELQGYSYLRYDLVDNPGYGYMGMNCENIPLYARKAIWSLMNRTPSIEAYYGTELAQVLERPMTKTVAEYPDGATEYYSYSREKALEYFELAGYTQKDGKLVNEAGEQFVVNCFIGGDGNGAHPAYAMLVQAAEDLAALGGELQIQDVTLSVIMATQDDGTADMWIMAWTSVYDCDKTTQFHTSGGQNKTRHSIPEMDALLDAIPQTLDLAERQALVAEMLDIAMENCIEYPLYQRKNLIVYNIDNVDTDTIPYATTAANFQNYLWQVVVK